MLQDVITICLEFEHVMYLSIIFKIRNNKLYYYLF